jgi:SAM-dependent methyltransferase
VTGNPPSSGNPAGTLARRALAALEKWRRPLDSELRTVQEEVRELRREVRARLLQYHHQLGRLSRAAAAGATEQRLSSHTMPMELDPQQALPWEVIGEGEAPPDPEGREWLELDRCPVCGDAERTLANPWNKFIVTAKAPDETAARYDYSVCHACGVLYAARRPIGRRYRFLLEHFGEATAKRGGSAVIANRLLNPYPLSDADRAELRRMAEPGIYVSDHLGLSPKTHLESVLKDRLENCVHVDVIGAFLKPRGARVLEVRSRAGTILDGLRRAWDADVSAMPIWESQQFILREILGIPTSDLIDFERFAIPFDGTFDLIVCNHMLTHAVSPVGFFDELKRKLRPGGHIYLYTEPDDAEYLAGKQSMFSTLNPLHMQAFDQASLVRMLAALGFETVFIKRRNLHHMVLARWTPTPPVMVPMNARERDRRLTAYHAAFDRAVLGVDEALRPRVASVWSGAVERGVAGGIADFDERGRLHLVAR